MKDVLKKLAEALPAEMDAECVELDNGSVWLGFRPQKGHPKQYIMSEGDALSNAQGTTVLKQYIESEGWSWWLSRSPYREYKFSLAKQGESVHDADMPSEAEAVAKAALEVAERGKK